MNRDFRNRVFLPVVLPLAILLAIVIVVGVFALLLLHLTKQSAVALALVAAAGVLVAVALAAAKDRLRGPEKGAVAFAALIPVVVGALFASGVVGGIPDDARMINVEPHGPSLVLAEVPADAPVLAAESSASFCLPQDGQCVETREWEITWDGEQFVYAFDNRETGVLHNLFLYRLEEVPAEADLPLGLTALEGQLLTPIEPPTFAGPQVQAYGFTPEEEVPEQLYFVCTVHASTMYGIATVTTG